MKKTKTSTKKTEDKPEPTKPGMPKEGIMLDVGGLTVRLDMDIERFSSGSMRMKIGGADVMEDDGKTKVGSVAPEMGCGISVVVGKRDFYIPPMTLWEIGKRANEEYQRRVDAGEV